MATENKNPHSGHRERMRKKFLDNDIDVFSDHEILEFLLYYSNAQRDTNPIAHDLLERFQNLNAVFEASKSELEEVKYVKDSTASLIMFVSQLIKRLEADRLRKRIYFHDVCSIADYCCTLIGSYTTEKHIMLSFDNNYRLIATDYISDGNTKEVFVDKPKIVKYALQRKASLVYLAHNHPGGRLDPSDDDIVQTNDLGHLLNNLGIRLADHIVCHGRKFTTMAERQILEF